MRKWCLRLLLLAGLAVAGVWLWRAWFPNPEKAIRRRLAELAQVASFGPNEGALAKAVNCDKLAGFFTDDAQVKVDVGGYAETFNGREPLRAAALSARSALTGLKVDFPDINITLGPDKQSAEVELTALGKVAGEADPQVYVFRLMLKRVGGEWLIRRVETVKTLI
jgi:hypothetical protein